MALMVTWLLLCQSRGREGERQRAPKICKSISAGQGCAAACCLVLICRRPVSTSAVLVTPIMTSHWNPGWIGNMSTFTFSCRIPGCKHRYYNPLHAMQCKRARLPGSACTQGTHLKTMPCQYTCRWRVTKTTACLTTKVSSPYMC